MSIEALPKPGSQTERETTSGGTRESVGGASWIRGLVIVGVIALAASGAYLYINVSAAPPAGPSMTHEITRGDLVISVTEQGTLESFQNTEIKCRVRGSNTVTWVIPSGTVVKKGDDLVRLDTKVIEETVSLQKTNVFEAISTLEETRAEVAEAEIAIDAYLDGRFRSQLKGLETSLAIAESNLRSAQKMYNHSKLLYKRGFVTIKELEGNAFTVTQAELELNVIKTNMDVLSRFTKKMQMTSMNGRLQSSKSKLQADEAGLRMSEIARDRALEELTHCTVVAPQDGLVIYPRAAAWKDSPDITEGGRVTKDQVMLVMPDLSQMQIKVGIHESMIDRVEPGLTAQIRLPELDLEATVTSVASVTRPAGWWTGNVVKYDTIIQLPEKEGLKPGMSAEVNVILAEHRDVLRIPVAAVVATENGHFCWVKTAESTQKRLLQLGDSNDVFIIVEQGLQEGEHVVLNPLAIVDEAQDLAITADAQAQEETTPEAPAEDNAEENQKSE